MALAEHIPSRLDVIFNGIANGLSTQQIDDELKANKKEWQIKRGNESDSNANRLLLKCWGVQQVFEVTDDENHSGADKWIHIYRPRWRMPDYLPVQVKSSTQGIQDFKDREKFQNYGGIIVLIDAHEHLSATKFKRQFNQEIRRINRRYNTRSHCHFDLYLIDFYRRITQYLMYEDTY